MECEASTRRHSTRQLLKRSATESVEDLERATLDEQCKIPCFTGKLMLSAEKKRRKKRRSSFVSIVGRKSGDFRRPVNKLCQSIPKDIPEHERLEKLTTGALDHALLNLQHENPDLDLGSLVARVRDAGLTVIDDLKKQGHFVRTCATRQSENPINVQNQKIAQAYESRIVTLTKETSAWDRQLEKARNLCMKAQKQLDQMDENAIRLPPKTLTANQQSLLEELSLDQDKLEDELKTVHQRLTTYVNKLEVSVNGLRRRHETAASELTRLAQTFHDSIHRDNVDPREAISCLVETWTIPAEI